MLHFSGKKGQCGMGAGGRHPRLFRQNFPRLDDRQYPHGQGDPNEVAQSGYVYQNELFPTDAGTPQGGIISPAAANMTLDGLEAMLAEKFPQANGSGLKMNIER